MTRSIPTRCISIAFALFLIVPGLLAQNIGAERTLHQNILKAIKKDIQENYYDPKFRGVDLEAAAKKASEYINSANSLEEMTDVIARFLLQFDDSHMFFLPPPSTTEVDYGWEIQMIGDKAYVTDVKEKSNAWAKGIRPGDQLHMLEGYIPTRQEFWILRNHYEFLSPQPKLEAVIVKPGGKSYKVVIEAKVTKDTPFMPSRRDLQMQYERMYDRETRQSFYDEIPGLCIWKMPSFNVGEIKLDKMTDKLKKCSALVLDLRGNGGGLISALYQLTENFFDRDITLGTLKKRDGDRRMVVKFSGAKPYDGKLVVLIDSESASAAELFARIVQLEKRGIVVGDGSAGAVMQAIHVPHHYGLTSVVPYGASVTNADIVMRDGQRLEKIGVSPDEKVLPTPADMLNNRDPALARAVGVLGFTLTSDAAGKIFPKKKDD